MSEDMAVNPNWDRLYETAAAQAGQFTTRQAADAGYSPQLLAHHLRNGRVLRERRGVYRLTHFPAGDHEEFVTIWLWSELAGVFSHQTALLLHDLSDVLAAQVHLSLPTSWRKRRLRVPEGVVLHHADVDANEKTWVGPVPITSVSRTLEDSAAAGMTPELLSQAARQALERGLTSLADLGGVERALAPFGGLGV